ncbi:MAG: hypothetical protein JO061_23610 [Acidobacteriaceae bacterium]|nr:hypothetical protein [Acidobacteriaceae bacterium]
MRRLNSVVKMTPALLAALFASVSIARIASPASTQETEIEKDVQLRAMTDELARSKTLQLSDLDKPYFIAVMVSDGDEISVSGSLGGLVSSSHVHLRYPRVDVRVGSYSLDNTNSVFSVAQRLHAFPIDDDYPALRASLWLSSDALYKAAADQIARKRNALRELENSDKTPDFAPAPPVQVILPPARPSANQREWEASVRRLSAQFSKYPAVLSSSVRLMSVSSTYRLVNTEGTVVRVPQELAEAEIRSRSLAPDGTAVWNHVFVAAHTPAELPGESSFAGLIDKVAAETQQLQNAPAMEAYTGPVLFEQQAAAQMMAEVIADAAILRRKPVAPAGSKQTTFLDSVWESRSGTRVAPDWLTLIDDPTRKSFHNEQLAGFYNVDDEGVPPKPVTLVEKGTLKSFLLTRQPVKTYNASNGHGRLPGQYGNEWPVIGNLFVEVAQPIPEAEMKTKLIDQVKAAGLKYGLLIRRIDFPSTASADELQGIAQELQKRGYARTITPPLLAYRVYPDGREELVRGARFMEFSAKNLRDLLAASDRAYVLNYLNRGTSFNLADVGSNVSISSVICPSL